MTKSAVSVWDLPTRLFHWLLVILIGLSWWSAETRTMEWHYRSGLAILGLVVFRLVWGFIGGSTARFAQFVRLPGAALDYLRGKASNKAGHNPLGGYSVIALLGLVGLQTMTGLFSSDTDGLESGPLSHWISDYDTVDAITDVHEASFNLLLGLIGLHILAILFYRFVRRRNLVTPMVTGRDAELPAGTQGLVPAGPLRFIIAAAIGAGTAWAASKGFFL
jgi:cytochrome b